MPYRRYSGSVTVSSGRGTAKITAAYSRPIRCRSFQALGPSVKIKPEVLKTAMDSGRMQWKMRPMHVEKNREDVKFAGEIMRKAGTLPKAIPDSYFAT